MFSQKSTNEKISFREAFHLFISSVKKVWQFDKKYVVFTCIVLIMDTILTPFSTFVVAIFNQRIIVGGEKYSFYLYAYYPLLVVFFVIVFNGVIFSIWRWIETQTMDKMTSFLLREFVKKASTIDYASYDNSEFYDRVQKGWAQDGKMFVNSASNVFNSISCLLGITAYISILAYVDWKLMIAITVLRICFNPFINKTYTLI